VEQKHRLLLLQSAETVCMELRPLTGPLSNPHMTRESIQSRYEIILTGENLTALRRNCPSASLSTTNSTRTTLGSNLGLRNEKPATNRLSYGTVNINTTGQNNSTGTLIRYYEWGWLIDKQMRGKCWKEYGFMSRHGCRAKSYQDT
jgi:hypothetical protein